MAAITAIIIWRQGSHELPAATIDALQQGTLSCGDIFVLEDGRPQQAKMRLRRCYPEVPVLTMAPNQGQAYLMQCGVRLASGTELLLLDAGTVLQNEALAMLAEHLTVHSDAALVQPLLLITEKPELILAAGSCLTPEGWALPTAFGQPAAGFSGAPHPGALPNEFCALLKKDKLVALGGFDVLLTEGCSLVELGIRILASGDNIGFVAEATARHPYCYPERTPAARLSRLLLLARLLPGWRFNRLANSEFLRDSFLSMRALLQGSTGEGAIALQKWFLLARQFRALNVERRRLAPWWAKLEPELTCPVVELPRLEFD